MPVEVEQRGSHVRLTLADENRRNSLTASLASDLSAELQRASEDASIRAVVLTARGGTFCSGADLRADRQSNEHSDLVAVRQLYETLIRATVPVIARVNGHVRGGGTGLVAGADVAVALRGATFAFSEVRLGVVPAMVAPLVVRRMSARDIAELFVTGSVFDADRAHNSRLINYVAEDEVELDETVQVLIGGILRSGPRAVALARTIPDRVAGRDPIEAMRDMEQVSRTMFESEEAQQGVRAFLDRQSPPWVVEAQTERSPHGDR